MSSISAVMPKGGLADPSVWKKPRRTFEAIVKELGWHYNAALNSATKPYDECVGYLFNDGHAEWMFYPCQTYSALALTATELAAIAAACSELAANYAAEHGKEDA